MKLGKTFSSHGASRDEHAANIMQGAAMWAAYEDLHTNALVEAGRNPFAVVNADGSIAEHHADKIVANKAVAALATNATLRHEDFLTIRDKIVEVRRRSLNGITDLMGAGLSFDVSIGEQLVGFETVNEFAEADQDMNPNSYQNNDTVFGESYVPNPITHQSFQTPWRQQGFDYKRSLGLTESARQVAERLEQTLFNGNAGIVVNFNGTDFPIYGYTNHPDRGTGTISDWTNPANYDVIVSELIAQIGLMWSTQGGVSNDSVVVYVANDIWTVLQNDYNSGFPSKVIFERMMDIAQVKDIKPAEKLASGQVVLVEMESRTIELAKASDIIAVPHTKTNPMAPQVMTTYAAMVQQIKVDSNGNTGIRHLTV